MKKKQTKLKKALLLGSGAIKKSLAVRIHRCPYCGLELDRDYNSAIDILKLGLEKIPQGLREFTPVEIGPLRELETIPASLIVEAGSHLPELR